MLLVPYLPNQVNCTFFSFTWLCLCAYLQLLKRTVPMYLRYLNGEVHPCLYLMPSALWLLTINLGYMANLITSIAPYLTLDWSETRKKCANKQKESSCHFKMYLHYSYLYRSRTYSIFSSRTDF